MSRQDCIPVVSPFEAQIGPCKLWPSGVGKVKGEVEKLTKTERTTDHKHIF